MRGECWCWWSVSELVPGWDLVTLVTLVLLLLSTSDRCLPWSDNQSWEHDPSWWHCDSGLITVWWYTRHCGQCSCDQASVGYTWYPGPAPLSTLASSVTRDNTGTWSWVTVVLSEHDGEVADKTISHFITFRKLQFRNGPDTMLNLSHFLRIDPS